MLLHARALALRALVALSLIVVACAPRQDIVPDPEPVYVEPPPPPRPPVPARWSVAIEDLGWAQVPEEPSKAAFRSNTEGWRLHEDGNWAGSRAAFAEAVRELPEYDLARYNLACAYSRVGQLEQALETLTDVLVRDLPRFRRRAREDQDLQRLRSSALREELDWRVDRIAQAWERALRGGVSAVAWRRLTRTRIAQAQDSQGQLLRPGVWVDEIRRFLPAMELYEGVHAGYVDTVHEQAIVVTAERTADAPPLFASAHLYVVPLVPVGDDPHDTTLTYDKLGTIEVHAVPSGARFRMNHYKTAWQVLDAAGVTRDQQATPSRPVMFVTPDGALLTSPIPEGMGVKNRTVTTPGGHAIRVQSVQSISNYRSLVLNGDGTQAVLVGVRAKCSKDGPDLRHAVDRLDLAQRRAVPLSQGEGPAAAAFGPDGALYVQVEDRTRRYGDPRSERFETLPEGVVLVPPLDGPTCK